MHLAYWDNSRDTFGRIRGTIYMLKCAVEYNMVTQKSFQAKAASWPPTIYRITLILSCTQHRMLEQKTSTTSCSKPMLLINVEPNLYCNSTDNPHEAPRTTNDYLLS